MPLSQWLLDPELQSSLLPLLLSLVLTTVLMASSRTRPAAAAGLVFAWLAMAVVIADWPGIPPKVSGDRLFLAVAVCLCLGVALDILPTGWRGHRWLLVIPLALGMGWIAISRLTGPWDFALAATIGALVLALALTSCRLGVAEPLEQGLTLLFSSLGIGAVALFGTSASIAQLAFALGAASGGMLLVAVPSRTLKFKVGAALGGGMAVLGLATQLALYTRSPAWALLPLLLCLFADQPSRWLGRAGWHESRIGWFWRAAIHGAVCALAAALTAALAYFGSDGSGPYAG